MNNVTLRGHATVELVRDSYKLVEEIMNVGPIGCCNISEQDAEKILSLMQPEIDRRVAEEKAKLFERLRTPSDAACVGLARDIMMWLDMDPKTPRALFKHLERIGREIPQWLREEPEMQSLDHVPSKATRCAIIWQAMVPAFQQENSDER